MVLGMGIQEQAVLEDTVIRVARAMEAMVSRVAQDMAIKVLPVMELMVTRDLRASADMDTSRHRGPEGMDPRAGNMFEKGAKWLAVLHLSFETMVMPFAIPDLL
jgi:hypothetical protein